MARLAVGLAGAGIGGLLGGGFGARLGFTIGSFVGGQLFPDAPTEVEGPRLGDLNVSQSTYGVAIPLGYGTLRMAGMLTWAGEVQEVENNQEQGGGKGGSAPSSSQTTYSYFGDFAYAFAEGPASAVTRIWMDKKIVFDSRGGANIRADGLRFKFYEGNETQLPDATIEATEGVGQVPGHRGLVYIVFESLDLTEYSNRPPQVEAEIAFASIDATADRFSNDLTTGEGGIFTGSDQDGMAIDHKRRRIYMIGTGGPTPGNGLRVYDLDTLQEIRQASIADITGSTSEAISDASAMHVGPAGFIYMNLGALNSRPIIKVDPDTLQEVGRFGFQSSQTTLPDTGAVTTLPAVNMITGLPMICAFEAGTSSHFNFLMARGVLGGSENLYILQARSLGLTPIFDDEVSFVDIISMIAKPPGINKASGWLITQASANSVITIYLVEVEATAGYVIDAVTNVRVPYGTEITVLATIDPSVWNSDGASLASATVDRTDEGIIFVIDRDSTDGAYTFKWRDDDGVVWTTQTDGGGILRDEAFANATVIQDGLIAWTDSSSAGESSLLDTTNGEILVNAFQWDSITPTANPVGQQIFDGRTQSIIAGQSGAPGALGQLFLNRVLGQGTTDGAIVTDLSDRVGFDTASDIDVTELTNPVRGYAVPRRMTARTAIEPLGTAFFWDGVESDDKIEYKERGRAAVRTIQDTDMVPLNKDTFATVGEQRTQEIELPERVAISYWDIDTDYLVGTQSVKRILSPDPTMRSQNEKSLSLAIVFNASEAKQIAEKIIFTAWNERTQYTWRTGWENSDLDPADVVNLVLNGTLTTEIRARITQSQMARDFLMEFTGFAEEQFTVVSDAIGGGQENFPQQVIPGPAFTRLFLLDIPLLRDQDDIGRTASRTHMGMNGFQANWPGGVLYSSDNGALFNNTGIKNPSGVPYGTVINSLPDTDTPFQTDTTTQLQVFMNDGELSSVTESEFLNDANTAIVGQFGLNNWEIILFKNATLQSDGSYILDTLMRGRRGTDVTVGNHGNGEFFFVADLVTMNSFFLDLALLNTSRFYKGVGTGQIPENADTEALASQMNDLRPYAPVLLDAVVDISDNIDLSWVRRTRVGGALRDGVGTVPLSEDTEEYEVEILDAPGGTVVRTFLGLVTPVVQYDKGDIITDLGVATGSITMGVTAPSTFTRATGSFVTDGLIAGMAIETANLTNGANNGIFNVASVSALSLVVEETTLVTEVGTGDETMTAIRPPSISFAVYQISAQVGRGFRAEATIEL